MKYTKLLIIIPLILLVTSCNSLKTPIVSSSSANSTISTKESINSYQRYDLIIKGLGLSGIIASIIFGAHQLRQRTRREKFDYFNNIYNRFLSKEFLYKRSEISKFWISYIKYTRTGDSSCNLKEIGNMIDENKILDCLNKPLKVLNEYTANNEQSILKYLKDKIGIEFVPGYEDKLSEYIKSLTDEVLNEYENLAKIYSVDAIDKKYIHVLFYSSIPDTFILTLSYILFRRRSGKPQYAMRMQKLLKLVPHLSLDITRV